LRRAFDVAGIPLKPGGHVAHVPEEVGHGEEGAPSSRRSSLWGWHDPLTPQRIYQQADPETLRAVVSSPTHRLTGRRCVGLETDLTTATENEKLP